MSTRLLLSLLFLTAAASAQITDATLSGTVVDPSGAAVPGASVTALNVNTGVAATTTTSNEAGIYLFASLQPGAYRLTAEHTGFDKYVLNDIVVDIGDRLSINLPLVLGNVSNAVEVRASSESSLAYATGSVGGVITGQKVQELPLPSRDALGRVLTQAGLVGTNFAGSQRVALDITLDGINVQDNRINSGIFSTLFTSVDRIEEVRVITSPADAEFGRGSGQIIMNSRSGTNQFHGSVFEANRNTSLTANTWFNNQRGDPRNFLVRNQFGARLGGPVRRNKTFFHFLWESERIRTRGATTRTVYTDTARRGLYRFFQGAQNGNALASRPTVDLQGNPLRPSTATSDLQTVDIFGRDPNRLAFDPTGVMKRFLDLMPLPNNFRAGDGLNTAGYTFHIPESDDSDQYDVRIDHHFSSVHRLSGSYNIQNETDANGFMPSPFPGLPGGDVIARTRVLSIALVSTFRSNLLNEFRGGFQRPLVRFHAPWELAGKGLSPARRR